MLVIVIAAVVFAVAFVLVFVLNAEKSGFESVPPEVFSSRLSEQADVQLVDVRTTQEFSEGHLIGAINVDVKQADFLSEAQSRLDAARPVFVYCRSGRRSADAAGQLAKAGYKVVNMSGGILEWSQKGLPTTKE
ncbi:MAG: rhodanese-like domain-containing protein [Bacteroidaceae bacterium]|nr:rhodanese-like domain-containing protein [Bacteroidaceae bacterium]